jgi:hypothetical protein
MAVPLDAKPRGFKQRTCQRSSRIAARGLAILPEV